MLDLPRSDWLASFAAFAEDANFTRAARAMHLSQPAFFAQIKKLEDSIGVPLYARRGRVLVLTEAGIATAAFARDVIARTQDWHAALRGEEARPTVLVSGQGVFLHLLGDALAKWIRAKKNLSLLVRDGTEALALVRSGEAHLGVAVLADIPAELERRVLREVPYAVALKKDHPLARRRLLKLRDLSSVPLVIPPKKRPLRATLDHAFAQAGLTLTVSVEAVGWDLAMRFTQLGLGPSIVNGIVAPPKGVVLRPMATDATGLTPVSYTAFYRRGQRERIASLLEDLLA